jgi:UDP-N-acetylglucosamine 2-epimerase (non-hydrolysing)
MTELRRRGAKDGSTSVRAGGAARVAVIVGTRPEAIKMAPVIHALRARAGAFEVRVIATSQHRELLAQALAEFGIVADRDLDLMEPGQSLGRFSARCLDAVTKALVAERPQLVLVQGDTTTVAASAMAAAYLGIPVGHVEAGLRSHDLENPFPEEINRRLAGSIATVHFAPTPLARRNLLDEGVPSDRIVMCGNTVVDAVHGLSRDRALGEALPASLRDLDPSQTLVLTTHRRENHGTPLARICEAVRRLVTERPALRVVFPVHPNPQVGAVVRSALGELSQVRLVEPLGYRPMLALLAHCRLILTDSGGIQEEAPSLGKPVLILREVTERPEVVSSGAGKLVGTDPEGIVRTVLRLLDDAEEYERMASARNPFGDGLASERIADRLEFLLLGRQLTPRSSLALA